ncbi:carboxypeptidase-like regulatory domain-containing protein [Polaribacter sp.]|uniref:carboxypeptidase-like regulatory domain-containing protein n=1 Tax=Polaribacter sp. TaxID=1920175 RepID=UPI0035C83778
MKTQLQLEIKSPCKENFNLFKQTEKGGFCNSCQKEVIDFSKMTSAEIINYFKMKSTKNTCGKFSQKQIHLFKPRRRINILTGIAFSMISFLSIGNIHAQKNNQQKQIKKLNNITLKGTVSDNNDFLPGVSVMLEGSNIGTETNFDGEFTFPKKLQKGDVIVFSYLGYVTKKVKVTSNNNSSKVFMNIKFEEDNYVLMGAVDVRNVYKSQKKS